MNEKQKYYASLTLFFIGFGIFILALFSIDYMPFKQKLLILSVATMATMALLIVTKAKLWRSLSGVLLILVSLYFVNSQQDLGSIAQVKDYELVDYDLLALSGQELLNNKVGIFGVRAEYHEELLAEFPEETEFINYDNLELLANALEEEIIQSFLINDNLVPTISVSKSINTYDLKTIARYSIKVDHKAESREIDVFRDSYLIYVSGIDVEGNVLTRSRNNMNFILAVNPKTNTILSIDIPKESYMRLACESNQMDTVENSGLYGIDCAMKTLEQYFQIEFNYYVRVNLAGIERLVDALDGIDVYSDSNFKGYNDTEFTKGYNRVSGAKALEYVRKEELLVDVTKGANSQHRYLLEAIMNKMLNENNIYSLPQHLSLLKNVLDTNFSNRDLSRIISDQISKKHNWEIIEKNLRGYSDMQILYTDESNQEQFIYWPGDGSKRDLRTLIEKVMDYEGKAVQLKTFY